MKHRITLDEFLRRLKEKHNGKIIYIKGFINMNVKCFFKCTVCGYVWQATPNSVVNQGHGCLNCKHIELILPLDEVKQKVKEATNDTVEYVSGYNGTSKKCKWRCKICGHEWEAVPISLMKGHKCPKCYYKRVSKRQAIPLDEFLELLKEVWGNDIEYVDGYTKMSAKCKFRCTICGYVWSTTPISIIRNKTGCRMCANKRISEKLTLSIEKFLIKLKEVWFNLVEYIEGYINTHTACKFRCSICGHEWVATPHNVLRGTGCPKCSLNSMEIPVIDALNKKKKESNSKFNYLHNVALAGCIFNKLPLRPDFRIETSKGKLVFETDGRFHFFPIKGEKELKKQQERDCFKNKYLKEHGYILIRVTSSPTKEWGFKNHITLKELLELIEIGIDSKTGEIDFELFKQYDFNRE